MVVTPLDEEAVFKVAAEIRVEDARAAYLQQVCGNDEALMKRVLALLRAHDGAPCFLESPPPALAATFDVAFESTAIGNQIGPYKLREQIGEGGMGVVYVAEQTEPVRRKVALKIIRPGMASRDVVARFEAERQALAMMDHPNIAHVFDGGATEAGQPYFVMELVQGLPITEYCDQLRLGTRERLDLFLKVCRAVHHAHQKGVIHRDLKPSNVLVPEIDGAAVPKVIDFGVAKAVGQKLSEQTVYTQFSQLVGTPLYMSPEQAGLGVVDVDTRSDVYSLGVLLYELLTGQTPFDTETLKHAGFDEMRRMIREDERPRPSAMVSTLEAQALSTVAERRGCEPRKLTETLRGELDWLVMKALEKDRNQRYESASNLAADVSRYLNHEPIEASAPSVTYQLRKFVRRHRSPVIVAASLLLALFLGTIGTTTGWLRATQAEAEANRGALLEAEARKSADRERLQAKGLLARMQLERGVSRLNGQDQRGLLNLVDAWIVSDESPDLQSAIGRLWAIAQESWSDRLAHVFDGGGIITFSPNGKLLAIATGATTTQLWDLSTGQPYGRPLQLEKPIRSVVFSPDGERLATHSSQGTARIWETRTQRPVGTTLRHEPALEAGNIWSPCSAAFSPDGKLLATGAPDGAVRFWNTETGEPHGQPLQHEHALSAIAFSPDGRFLATGSQGGVARLWNVASGQPYGRPFPSALPEYANHSVRKVTFSPDGKLLAIVCTHDIAALCETETGRLHKLLRAPAWILDLAFSPDGKRVATATVEWTAQLWDTNSGETLGVPMRHAGRVESVAFSPNGKLLATGSRDQTVRLWNTATGKPHGPSLRNSGGFSDHGGVRSVVFSPDGRFLAAAGEVTQVWRVDRHTDRPSAETQSVVGSGVGVSVLSRDGKFRATITEDQTVELVDTSTGSVVNDRFRHGRVKAIAFSPDSRLLATGSDSHSAKIWEAATGRLRQTLECSERVYGIAFSPDGQTLATGLLDGTVVLWDYAAGRRVGLPLRHEAPIWQVAFSPDGKLMASLSGTAAHRKHVWFWDVTTGPDYVGLRMPHITVTDRRALRSFSLDGKLDLGTSDETSRQWSLPSPPNELRDMRLRSWVALGLQQDLNGQVKSISPEQWRAFREELKVRKQRRRIRGQT